MFNIKRFNSGEYEVTLTERIREQSVKIYWNYYKQTDIIIPILKAAAIKQTYGDKKSITLVAPYLPYSRQERQFEAGQAIHFEVFLRMLEPWFDNIETMGLHCGLAKKNRRYGDKGQILNKWFNIYTLSHQYNIVFPDESARVHYYYPPSEMYTFIKHRNKEDGAPVLELDKSKLPNRIDLSKPFLICDDVGDGNRTFVECAKTLRQHFQDDKLKIELLLYNSFCSYGLLNLIDAGVAKMKIINPDSYNYLIAKFPTMIDFFELIAFEGEHSV